MNEGAPFSVGDGKARAAYDCVLFNAVSVEAAAIDHESQIANARKRHEFARGFKTFKVELIGGNHNLGTAEGSAGIGVSMRDQLREQRSREQRPTHQRQHRGCNF